MIDGSRDTQQGIAARPYYDCSYSTVSSENCIFQYNLVCLDKRIKILLGLFSYNSRDYGTDVLETIADIPRITRYIKNKNSTSVY